VLKILSADVKRKIFRVNNTSHEAKILGNEILTVVHDENSSDIELDVVLLLLGLEHIERSSLGNKDDRSELKTSFNGELLNGKVVFPVVGKTLVETGIFFLVNLFCFLHPDRFVLVEFLHFSGDFLYLLHLFLFLILSNFNIFFLLFLFIFIVRDFLLCGLFNLKRNRERDELRVLLD
jgi:hypothetical protein